MNNGERNYFINAVLFIAGFVVISTGIIQHLKPEWVYNWISPIYLKQLHIWIGYAMSTIIIVHLLLHSAWIGTLTQKVFTNPKKMAAFASLVVLSITACYLVAAMVPQNDFRGQMGPRGGTPPFQSNDSTNGGPPNGYGPPGYNNQ